MGRYLDEDGTLLKGRFKGETLDLVVDADVDYVKWLLKEGPLDAEEQVQVRKVLREAQEAA